MMALTVWCVHTHVWPAFCVVEESNQLQSHEVVSEKIKLSENADEDRPWTMPRIDDFEMQV
jgi:hypothetical protein